MSLLEEELRQVERELTLVKQTIQEVFTFNKNVDLRILGKDHFLLCNVEKLFFDVFDRYLSDHLIPATLSQLQDPRLNEESKPQRFQTVLRNLYGCFLSLENFWQAVEKNPQTLEKIREKIKGRFAYKVLPTINASAYFQLFLEQYFSLYQETIRQSIQKAQSNESLQQLAPKLLLIQSMLPSMPPLISAEHLSIGFIHQFVQLICSSDELFQDELHKMLAKKCEIFISNLLKPGVVHESRQSLVSTFFNIYIRRFFEHIVHEVTNNLKPLRSTQGQIIPVNQETGQQRQAFQSTQWNSTQMNNFIREPLSIPNNFKKIAPQMQQDFVVTPDQRKGENPVLRKGFRNMNDPQTKGRSQALPGQFYAQDEALNQHKNTDSLPFEHLSVKFRMEDLTKSLKILLQRLFIKFVEKNLPLIVENFDQNIVLIADLKKALNEVGSFEELSLALEIDVINPLISLSKSTPTLLDFYINLLKFWSSLDHDFQMLQKSTSALKRYLISREDALRCIIGTWVAELKSKDKNNPSLMHHSIAVPIGDDKEDITDPENSEDSDVDFHIVNSKKESSKLKYKKCDVKTLLVDLYGSKEKFLKEYENYLAEKLLLFENINPREEAENIQLLKKNLKFGNNVTKWNILVSDMEFSEQMTNKFHEEAHSALNCDFLITSKNIWPINYDIQSFSVDKLPISKVQNEFNEFYMRHNKWRSVMFHNNLGKVELDFGLNGRTLVAQCQPIHAALISLFSETRYFESGVTLTEIARALDCTANFVRQKMHFWINHNIVKEGTPLAMHLQTRSFTNIGESGVKPLADGGIESDDLLYTLNHEYSGAEVLFIDKDEDNEMIIKGNDQTKGEEQSWQIKAKIEQLIKTILQGSGAKTQSKIFDLLQKLYAADMPKSFTSANFGKILHKMVRKNMIHHQGEIFYVS